METLLGQPRSQRDFTEALLGPPQVNQLGPVAALKQNKFKQRLVRRLISPSDMSVGDWSW